MLHNLDVKSWYKPIDYQLQQQALEVIELGKVVYMPDLPFELLPHEKIFLSDRYASPKTKNISFDGRREILQGAVCTEDEEVRLSQLMKRYATYAMALIENLLPHYYDALQQGRTSFRPVEIAGRVAPSYRKDDSRLHIDAFPATPTKGSRILRVFSNVNPNNQPRVWRLGAPFHKVLEYFHPKLKQPILGSSWFLNVLGITKERRTLYDHYMLQLHNEMKADVAYQEQVPQKQVLFPAGSSWIVYTDQVSHAAMSGQFTLEQTFYLPSDALVYIDQSPLRILERHFSRALL